MLKKKISDNAPDTIAEQLAMVPIRNERAQELAVSTEEVLVLEIPLKRKGISKFASRFMDLAKTKQVSLEGYSLAIFRRIDGVQTLANLVDQIRQEHLLTFYEARSLILQYMKILMEKGLVVIVKKE